MKENVKKVSRWASANGWRVGSHMHHGLFLVSRPLPGGELGANSRDWRVAGVKKDKNGTRSFEVLEENGHPIKNGAAAVMQRMLAQKGVSPAEPPTVNLAGVPAFPINALDQ